MVREVIRSGSQTKKTPQNQTCVFVHFKKMLGFCTRDSFNTAECSGKDFALLLF